jgi:hypothetical protein
MPSAPTRYAAVGPRQERSAVGTAMSAPKVTSATNTRSATWPGDHASAFQAMTCLAQPQHAPWRSGSANEGPTSAAPSATEPTANDAT